MLMGPVFRAELLRAARQRRYYALRVVYGLVLLFMISVGYEQMRQARPLADLVGVAAFAERTFHSFAVVQLIAVLLLVPSAYGGAVADEKQRKTLHYLMASRLSSGEIILDKVLGRSVLPATFVAIGLPVVSLLGLFGGVSPESVVVAYVGTLSTATFAVAMTVLISTLARRVRDAILIAYLLVLMWLLIPAVVLFLGTWFRVPPPWMPLYLWIRPINDWLVDMTPSGLWLRSNVFIGLDAPSILAQFLWMVGLQLAGAAILLLLAIWQLRPTARRQEGPAVRWDWSRSKGKGRWSHRPECGDDPVFWKERHFAAKDRLTRALLLAGVVLITVPLALMTWEYDGRRVLSTFWRSGYPGIASFANAPEGFLWALQVDLGWSVAFWLIAVAGASASCVSIEREQGTWDGLSATPLTGREILRGKMLGALWNQRAFTVVPLLIWVVGLVTVTVHPLGILLSIAMVGLLTWFVATVGVYASLRAASTSRAMTSTLVTLAFFNGYPLFPLLWFTRSLNWDPLTILGFLPSILAWSMIPPARFERWWSFVTTDGIPSTILWVVGGLALAGLYIYAGTALALTRRIIDRLDDPPRSGASHPWTG